MNPTEETVVRYALERGYLQQVQLAQARQEQAAREQRGQPSELLPILTAFLTPPQVQELRQVYVSASQAGLRAPPQPGQGSQAAYQSNASLPQQPGTQAAYKTHPSLPPPPSTGRFGVQNLPDGGEQTLHLAGHSPDGVTHSFMPPGVQAGPPAGSVHLGAPQYPNPETLPGGPSNYGPGAFGSTSNFGPASGHSQAPKSLPEAGDQIGDYLLVKEIARGGMGVVYEATDVNLGRRVALKLLLSQDLTDDDVLVRRFLTEARELSNLSHANIAGVYGASRDANGRHYMAMEFLEGEELKERIVRTGPIPAAEAAEIVLKLAHALQHCHSSGVLHRDIKPSNVILTPKGEPKLVDFGLARNVEDERERLTQTGEIMGTPAYMPPEQAGGEKSRVGPLADVYSLGATMYHMLAGEAPFRGNSVMNVINKVLSEDPAPPSTHNADIPSPLEAICLKAMEKELDDRYESAHALAEDLERFLGPRGEVSARNRGPIGRALRWVQRKGGLAVGVVCALIGVAVAVTAVLIPGEAEPDPSPTSSPVKETPAQTPQPSRARRSSIVVDPTTVADLTGLQVRVGWGMQVNEAGILLRATRGMGPELSLPFNLGKPNFDISVKAEVPYMSPGAGVRFELVPIRKLGTSGRPGGPARLRIEFTARKEQRAGSIHHGFLINWSDGKGIMRGRKYAEEFAFKEFAESAPIPLDFVVQVREENVTLIWGGRRKVWEVQIRGGRQYRLDVRPSPNRYEGKLNTEDQRGENMLFPRKGGGLTRPPKLLSPKLSALLLKELRLSAPGKSSLSVFEETHEWALVSALERRAIPRESLDTLILSAQNLIGASAGVADSNGQVRNEAGCLGAALAGVSGKSEEGIQRLLGLYKFNYRSDAPPRRTTRFQEWSPCLDEPTLEVFVMAYRLLVLSRLEEPEAFLARGTKYFADRRRPRMLMDTIDALNCLLVAKKLGAEVDPVLLGRVWLDVGDPTRALALLAPVAESGDLKALAYAGLAAYLLRKFPEAAGYWRRIDEAKPKALAPAWKWAYRRAVKLSK